MRFLATLFALLMLSGMPAGAEAQPPVIAAADLRAGQSLDGAWTYSIDPYRDGQAGFHGDVAGEGHRRYDDTDVAQRTAADPRALYEYDLDHSDRATLPASWLTHSAAMRHYVGLVWYQRRFDAVPTRGHRQFLRFGAVNYRAEVYLNGKLVGRHEGGFTPFTLEVTGLLRAAGNRLVVGADSQPDSLGVPPPVTDWENYGGITRSVRLIETPTTFIDDAYVRMQRDGRIAVDVALDGPGKASAQVTLKIAALGLTLHGKTATEGHWAITLPAPRKLVRWSPNAPRLYDVTVGTGDDHWRDRIGFRTVSVSGNRILLNGKPVFLRGISIHEEEIGPDPARTMTAEAARRLLGEARDGLHANFVRLAHYPHDETMLRAADEMGLLVWSEVPVYWKIAFDNADTLAKARAMQAENIRRDRNRAAIILWSVGNETPVSTPRNAFLRALIGDVRTLDPERLVTAALLNERKETASGPVMVMADPLADDLDVMAVNTYNGWYSPDRLEDLLAIHFDTPQGKPLIFSELGADAKAGVHAVGEPFKYSEEYQAEYYRQTLAMAEKVPNLAGMSPWILKDFRSPRRQHPVYQQGWNRKGLISETGERKAAFGILADWYAARSRVR